MRLLNKLIRKISGAELAQDQQGGVAGGKPNEELVPFLRQCAADGSVLLKNNGVLPFDKSNNIAVFGRVQYDYFYVGNGSGGDVRTPYKINLIEGLEKSGLNLNKDLINKYKQWCTAPKNIPDPGFWAHWPRYYKEMPVAVSDVKKAKETSDSALVVIGRSSGEDRENVLKKGSFYLTDEEKKLIDKVTSVFDKTVLVLNIGNIIDFEEIASYGDKISAILIVWQGGMESGNAVADVLSGKVNPSGKLTDTIAKTYADYPSSDNFGKMKFNNYVEDIYVGYRYFETFAPEKVLYEFGFGLSYTTFDVKFIETKRNGDEFVFTAEVTNTGNVAGKETLQLYLSAPQGKLGKAEKSLVGFKKTKLLQPGESQIIEIAANKYMGASFDDSGVTGNRNSYILEQGEYIFYLGTSVKKCEKVFSVNLEKDKILETLTEVMAVKKEMAFDRIKAEEKGGKVVLSKEKVPIVTTDLRKIILENLPEGKEMTGDKGYKLADVKSGKVSIDDFVAQLDLEELEAISRGEGLMNSSLGAEGNAGTFGGVTKSLRDKGIPAMTTTDGPSGIRLMASCSLLPCGTAIACTWDEELVENLFDVLSKEMADRKTDILLAPGMNIHRSPLCGRNFEYYSEDPLLSGKIASATVKGIQHNNRSACPKHFACNNQELNRNHNDSVVSQRALREIYLKGFEICVKEAKPLNIMTSYNKINGVWSHYNYELCTTVLRNEWGYDGNVVTDWWMRYAPSPEFPEMKDNAYRVRAQVDVLMPGGKTAVSKTASNDGTLTETYGKKDGITLGEMQRSAKNVLNYILKSGKI
ncbi:MAG: glycoside hydrolase family 3 protein [Clostridia bacterium]|nr:glycoside hydrolase family 3 protein [Clostridia bacterium]